MRGAPPKLPGARATESPVDRALALHLSQEREAALRWAAAVVQHDPGALSGLLLVGRLCAELGRPREAVDALDLCIQRSIDVGILPIAVAACGDLRKLGHDPGKHLDAIADAFAHGSPRLGDGSPPPPPLPPADDFHPLPSVLSGMALVNKTTAILQAAKKSLEEAHSTRAEPPRINPAPLFSSLGREGLRRMIEAFSVDTVPAQAQILRQGDPGLEAFIVVRGELEVLRKVEGEPRPISLARLSSGTIFGEMALLSRAPRAASVVACKPSILLRASKESLDAVAEAEPAVGQELSSYCRRRMVQNLLRTSSVLRAVPPEERPALVDRFVARSFEKGERLIGQGETASGLYFIASGEVAVVRDEETEPFVLATLGAGDIVGEVSMVLRRPSTASVVAVHPTITLVLPKEAFVGLIQEQPLLLAQLYLLAIKRDDETTEFVSQEEILTADDDEVVPV